MADSQNLSDQVDAVAQTPAAIKFDGVEVSQHGVKDLDEVARNRAADRAVDKPHRGLRFNRIVAPGASE